MDKSGIVTSEEAIDEEEREKP